ncbi:Putative light- and oxygen-sensing transcriptionregulator [Halapricum desulfuricans]|uniref:Light- and oxygen-sensing transcriptionregulator n=1 Tax=Halapricum desulfuricans TaxID=2841257 RepID=A0A897NKP8_9EURY|nr:Putative light- and oxygen-sensing transcriptionregulator [Halapricum desulfuricans]
MLLVDDSERWATLARRRIERATEEITVSVASDANEAVVQLHEHDRIDCLVVDYMMPGITGLELLERVRADHPDLPFILITSEGNEDVAARAIEAGVTEYVVKDPATDQTPLLVEKIQSVVTQRRLRRQLEESERRYRTVVEDSRDGICVLKDGCVQFCNQSFAALTGRDCDSWLGDDLVEEAVHSDEREEVRAAFENWSDGRTEPERQEARLRRPDETVRICELTGQRITENGETALLVSIRDVSERRRRERALRWERDLNRSVQEALVESRTRSALEQTVVEHLRAYEFPVAWIADGDDNALSPRAVAGDEPFVNAITVAAADAETSGEPAAWTARSGEPQFVQDIEALFPSAWRDVISDHGYRAGAAVPLEHNNVPYGVLAVYHDEPDWFGETERRLLTELGDAVAFGIHSLATENTLAADRSVTARLRVADETYYLVDLATDGAFQDCDRVCVQGTVPDDEDGIVQYLQIEGATAEIQDALAAHPDVRSVYEIAAEPRRLQVTVTGPSPEAHLATRGVIVNATTVDSNGVIVEAQLQSRETVTPTVERLQAAFDGVTVRSIIDEGEPSHRGDQLGAAALTDKQRQALRAAYHHGYFKRPRESTADEIAETLGVSHSTFLQHLHRAQQKVFEARFE